MTYFKPLRRKIGLATLLLACVFAVGMLRSLSRYEGLVLQLGKYALGVESELGAIEFNVTIQMSGAVLSPLSTWSHPTNINPADPLDGTPWAENHDIEWRTDWLGFHIGVANLVESGQAVRRDYACRVPYWSVVIPLTLLSAYLLLSRPRAKQIEPPAPPKI